MEESLKIKIEIPLEPSRNNNLRRVVNLFFTQRKSGEVRNFRCIECGKLLFKYESDLTLIVDGTDAPEDHAGTDHLCTRCEMVYRVLI